METNKPLFFALQTYGNRMKGSSEPQQVGFRSLPDLWSFSFTSPDCWVHQSLWGKTPTWKWYKISEVLQWWLFLVFYWLAFTWNGFFKLRMWCLHSEHEYLGFTGSQRGSLVVRISDTLYVVLGAKKVKLYYRTTLLLHVVWFCVEFEFVSILRRTTANSRPAYAEIFSVEIVLEEIAVHLHTLTMKWKGMNKSNFMNINV